jgi:hypothetical protein
MAAALFAAGVVSAVEALAPQTVPRWPQFPLASLAVPVVGAVQQGLGALTIGVLGLFVLGVLERVTRGWQRHRWSVFVALAAALTATSLAAATPPLDAVLGGLVAGLVTAFVVYGLLRFDYRAVPAFCATGVVLGFAETAAPAATAGDWLHVAVVAAVAAAVAWAATAYLARAGAAPGRTAPDAE